MASYFYVSNSGNDNNSGLSESQPWRTVSKVNNYNFTPGDVVCFRCGDIWREQLIPQSGNENGSITYTSYGTGNKPSLYGSVSKNSASNWIEETTNIWKLNTNIDNTQSVPNVINQNSISLWQEDSSLVKYDGNMSTNGFIKIDALASGSSWSSIQLIIRGLNIEGTKNYVLSFSAKCTQSFKLPQISLMKDGSPWTTYYSDHSNLSPTVLTDWTNYSIYYTANCSDSKARITFFLGTAIPKGSTLYLNNISFTEIINPNIYSDVGNIIFNDGESCGIKVFNESQLISQNKFWYDKSNQTLKIYSIKNPAEIYNKIECAVTKDIINESNKSYVIYNGLDLRYGSAHGIGGDNTHHISIQNCDISYIGGGELGNYSTPVRYGNGIEFWNNAHDNLVDGCNIWQIYDSGITNQGNGNGIQQYNLIYRNNTIINTEWSYEYWTSGTGSKTYNILFDNNICLNAGYSWSNSQRPDPTGFHLRLYSNTASISSFAITNNQFENAKQYVIYIYPSASWTGIENLQFKNNTYIQSTSTIAPSWFTKVYTLALT